MLVSLTSLSQQTLKNLFTYIKEGKLSVSLSSLHVFAIVSGAKLYCGFGDNHLLLGATLYFEQVSISFFIFVHRVVAFRIKNCHCKSDIAPTQRHIDLLLRSRICASCETGKFAFFPLLHCRHQWKYARIAPKVSQSAVNSCVAANCC